MIVLDTHAWLFWVDDTLGKLSKRAEKEVTAASSLGVSVISCLEIAMLVAKQRLSLNVDVMRWIGGALSYPGIVLLDLDDPEIVVTSTRLPGAFHGDPADRMIVSTCMKHGATLVSKDNKIHEWRKIRVVW